MLPITPIALLIPSSMILLTADNEVALIREAIPTDGVRRVRLT